MAGSSRISRMPENTGEASSGRNRSGQHRWKKGESGNPGGRPKIDTHVRELARQHTTAAIDVLAEIMRDASQPAGARARSAQVLLDRAWGTPETTANITVSGTEPTTETLLQIVLTDPELAAIIGARLGDDGVRH